MGLGEELWWTVSENTMRMVTREKLCVPVTHLVKALLLPRSEALGPWHGGSHLSTLTH